MFPVPGFGIRFLPTSRAMPRELVPIVDNSSIKYAIEEAVSAAIETLVFVTDIHKRDFEVHFHANN